MLASLRHLPIRFKLVFLIALFSLGLLGFSLLAFRTLFSLQVNGPLYHRIVQGKDLIADILPPPEYIIEANLVVHQMIEETNPSRLKAMIAKGDTLRHDYETRHDFWQNDLPEGSMKRMMVEDSYTPAMEFFRIRDEQFIPALMSGQREKARQIALVELQNKYMEHRAAIDRVVKMATDRNAADEAIASATIKSRTIQLIVLAVSILLLVIIICLTLARSIGGTLRTLSHETQRLISAAAQGELHERGDETVVTREFQSIIIGINRMLDSIAMPLDELSTVLHRLTENDLAIRMVGNYQGDLASIKNDLNHACAALASNDRIAKKQIAYQEEAVSTLVNNLGKLAKGDLHIDTSLAPADEDTRDIGRVYERINDSLVQTVE
ncbi:MAG TPA: hypothetical protein VHV83_09905, partial [Armatimonadota bacterium]|nr:hypothetical protein [Armatimonadota bacterium]